MDKVKEIEKRIEEKTYTPSDLKFLLEEINKWKDQCYDANYKLENSHTIWDCKEEASKWYEKFHEVQHEAQKETKKWQEKWFEASYELQGAYDYRYDKGWEDCARVFAFKEEEAPTPYRFTLAEYQMQSARTLPTEPKIPQDILVAALGLCGEAGEAADYIKKVEAHGHQLDKKKLAYELGDVLWYVAALCTYYDLNMEAVGIMNINKLKQRYPGGFSAQASEQRVDAV